jgi:hypothetical protein
MDRRCALRRDLVFRETRWIVNVDFGGNGVGWACASLFVRVEDGDTSFRLGLLPEIGVLMQLWVLVLESIKS